MASFNDDMKSDGTLTDGEESGEMDADVDSDKEEASGLQGELGEWLDQLQALSEELDSVRPLAFQIRQGSISSGISGVGSKMISTSSPSINALPPVKPKPPPVPPKPPMDICRYSMVNMEESADIDLDVLLSELYALENELNNGGTNALLSMIPCVRDATTTQAPFSQAQANPIVSSNTLIPPNAPTKPSPQRSKNNSIVLESVQSNYSQLSNSCAMLPNGGHNGLTENGAKLQNPTESSSCVGHRAQSPSDNDSAFCDSASMMSSESMQSSSGGGSGGLSAASLNGITAANISGNGRVGDKFKNGQDHHQKQNRHSNASSDESSARGSVNTPSPTQMLEPVQTHLRNVQQEIHKENLTEEERNARLKAEKIKLALQKMKEANVKKLYVKIFTPDGSSKSLLMDETWTVSFALHQLAEKNLVPLSPTHAIVEYLPDLYMERLYEDHEQLLENLLMWTRDSANKLYFVERPQKYHLFAEPQCYLLDGTNSEKVSEMDQSKKDKLLEEFFSLSHIQPPEIEGLLYLKSDGKKAWKKYHFVLRASGLYYSPKGKGKSSKDLVCLMNLEMVQVYNGLGWKKKYKAPTEFGFALKHPQIQVKASTYIKYLCAEDEKSHQRWLTGLRIAKSGRTLLENYQRMLNSGKEFETPSCITSVPVNSIKNSTSTPNGSDFYCKNSIVMRPSRNGTLEDTSSNISHVSLRPRSADIGRSGHQKRNSRTLTHVDVPVLSNAEPSVSIPDGSPGLSRRSVAPMHNGGSAELQTPTPDTQSINGFDSEFPTGTIKRQPTSSAGPSKILPAYAHHHNVRLPLTESTKHIHLAAVLRKHNEGRGLMHGETTYPSNGTSDHSGSSRSLNQDENDSDEESPPSVIVTVHAPPQRCSTSQDQFPNASEFPPAPSPLPQVHFPVHRQTMPPQPLEVKIVENAISPSSSTLSSHSNSASYLSISPGIVNDSNGHQYSNGNCILSASSQAHLLPGSCQPTQNGKQPPKKLPPAPPKRAENTRLSTITPVPTPKPKPAIAAKPKLLPPSVTATNGSSNSNKPVPASPTHSSSNRLSSNDDGFSNSFQNELQRAMQKRLQKIESGITDGEKKVD